jgi:hypothetical protein
MTVYRLITYLTMRQTMMMLFLYNAKSYFKCFVIQLCCCSFLHHLNRWVCHPRRSILFLMNFINSRLGCPLLLWLTNKYRYVWIFALVHDFFRPVGLQPKVSSKNHRSAKEKFLGDRYHPSKFISPLHFFSYRRFVIEPQTRQVFFLLSVAVKNLATQCFSFLHEIRSVRVH